MYSGSKRAVRGLTDALRVELMGSGVDVVYCAPGWVRTNIAESGAAGGLNQLDTKGPWAPCAKHVVEDLFEHEGANAVTPAQFAAAFCNMASRRYPPSFWSNSMKDGCVQAKECSGPGHLCTALLAGGEWCTPGSCEPPDAL